MEREDSGVIDLFAIQKRASEAPPASNLLSAIPTPLASMPPPAFTTDLLSAPTSTPDLGDGPLDDDENPFANARAGKKRLFIGLAGAAALLVVAIGIAAFSGSDDAAQTANASAAKTEAAPAPPPPVVPPVPAADPAPPKNVPPPPTTGAVATKPAPAAKAKAHYAKARAKKSSWGPKLEKVQSAGIPGKS